MVEIIMANFKKNDEAVSAVIGVILMVAITVILAAVIAAFVFQLGGSTPKPKNIGVDIKRVSSDVFMVKTMSGTDIATLVDGCTQDSDGIYIPTYEAVVAGETAKTGFWDSSTGTFTENASNTNTANKIGQIAYFKSDKLDSGVDVTIIAHFTDGTEYAIWGGNIP